MPIPFDPGGRRDKPDTRDYQYSEIGAASAPFDWNVGYDVEAELRTALNNPAFTIPVKDQGQSLSCGGQAWSYYTAVLEALATKTHEERSAKFIYAQTYYPGGGSAGRDNAIIYKEQGSAKESVLPSYENNLSPTEFFMEQSQDITEAIRLDAKTNRSLAYANVLMDFNSIAQAMRDNHGVILLVSGQNNGTWSTEYPQPPNCTFGAWKHWIYFAKAALENGQKVIKCLNSWGKDIGKDGWQTFRENYQPYFIQGWTHVYNPNPPVVGFTHNFIINLNYQDKSDEVVALQKALQQDGEFPANVPTTGFYGDITASSLLKFQLKYQIDTPSVLYGLKGRIFGPKSRAKMNELFNH